MIDRWIASLSVAQVGMIFCFQLIILASVVGIGSWYIGVPWRLAIVIAVVALVLEVVGFAIRVLVKAIKKVQKKGLL